MIRDRGLLSDGAISVDSDILKKTSLITGFSDGKLAFVAKRSAIYLQQMDTSELLPSLDLLASSGVVFSTHIRAVLETSLVLLKNSEKFESVHFWGKINGSKQDYYIAQGLGSNHLTEKKSFYR